jgi:glycogen operon protein
MTHFQTGPQFDATGVRFTIASHNAEVVWLCLFDESGDTETARYEMFRTQGGRFSVHVKDIAPGQRYGFRADGPWQPDVGHRFDMSKLLVDPHATLLDRPFKYQPDLGEKGVDTRTQVPKSILEAPFAGEKHMPVAHAAGGLSYEVCVKAFSKLNPDIPESLRGTLAAIAHPASIAHFKKLGVAVVELMPITAWIDERHLAPHGLANAWGYNPVAMMALDPRLSPNGIADLRHVADALHKEGIALVLDVVFNHTGESDQFGPMLSMRGLDNALYYRHHTDEPGALVNDTGTGNTLAVDRAPVRDLLMDAMRHFVSMGGVDGFRFDLCTVLGRTDKGFSPHAPLFEAMRHDPVLGQATLIAEPWDTGPGGYQLGNFPPQFLEWNDRFRDDVRRFWRGDTHTLASLATRLAGSSDYFSKAATNTRSVNFLAAHDGFTLADLTAYKRKHNGPNGENDRDGHSENFSWNHGVEGATSDPAILMKRRDDVKALLALLFVSRGTPLLCAGDEFGRTQKGNNNAYAQDNETTWLDWEARDQDLEDFVVALSALRQRHPTLQSTSLLSGIAPLGFTEPDISWFRADGAPMQSVDWEDGENRLLGMALSMPPVGKQRADRVAVIVNRNEGRVNALLPPLPKATVWACALASKSVMEDSGHWSIPAHCVAVFEVGR